MGDGNISQYKSRQHFVNVAKASSFHNNKTTPHHIVFDRYNVKKIATSAKSMVK